MYVGKMEEWDILHGVVGEGGRRKAKRSSSIERSQ